MNGLETGHIWLRQSVTFTVAGQTRTLEIGIPVPPHSSAQEIEALLQTANTGMDALSRHLDAQIAAALAGTEAVQPQARDALPQRTTATAPTAAPAARDVRDAHVAPLPASESAETPPMREPARTAPSAPPESRTAATAPTPSRQAQPAPQRPVADSPRTQPSATGTSAEMSRPQFLAAAAELGLNPRQAMDHLGVRSLEGLNLREALESLRRQLHGASSAVAGEPDVVETQPAKTANRPDPTPQYFEEEDDETILFSLDDETDDEEYDPENVVDAAAVRESPAGISAASALASDEIEDDLEDVPDLAPPPTPIRQRPASSVRENQATSSGGPSTNGARSRAMQLIGKLRTATGGGSASDYQRTAYRNIVEEELGKSRATSLVRGLWRTTADQLTSGQLDALIRWGKEEVFADEAAQVLATLRAEQQRAAQSANSANDAPPTTRERPPRGSRG
jgi:ribosomal protein L12E/L44/L45/RPP1/RPP2